MCLVFFVMLAFRRWRSPTAAPTRRTMPCASGRRNGRTSIEVKARVRTDGFTLVAINAIDFRRLYARETIHARLVIMLPQAMPEMQRDLFIAVIICLAGRRRCPDQRIRPTSVQRTPVSGISQAYPASRWSKPTS